MIIIIFGESLLNVDLRGGVETVALGRLYLKRWLRKRQLQFPLTDHGGGSSTESGRAG